MRLHPLWNFFEEGVNGFKFLIEGDADGLKGACGRVGLAGTRMAEYFAADFSELFRRLEFSGLGTFADSSREAARLPDISVLIQDIRERIGGE